MFIITVLLQVTPSEGMTLLGLLLKGGVVMIPIVLLSIAAIYFFVERLLYIEQAGKIDSSFLHTIGDKVQRGKLEEAAAFCQISNSPIARLLTKGLSRLGSSTRDIESAIENTAQVEIYQLEKHMNYLSAIAAIAPMMGFLGTVTGMIKAFYNISLADNISIGVIAGGIYEKMITSASGLLVGMLAYMLHTILQSRLDKVINSMEVASIQFMDLLFKVPQHELQEN